MSDEPTGAQPPLEEDVPRISEPPKTAAGLKSVLSAFSHMRQHGHSPLQAVRILKRMNQTDGFDCPGCAWPDPDDRAALAEYCENGAKAAEWDTTSRRLEAEFFIEHFITALEW